MSASYAVRFSRAALRQLNKLDLPIRTKIFAEIEKLGEDPRPRGVKRLEATEKLYRVSVGPGKDYRAVYQIEDDRLVVLVVAVGDRKEVYRHLT